MVNTLKLGVEWVYPFTEAHKLTFQGYLYHLEGLLTPADLPEELMKGVIERGEQQDRDIAEADRAEKRHQKRKHSKKSGQEE